MPTRLRTVASVGLLAAAPVLSIAPVSAQEVDDQVHAITPGIISDFDDGTLSTRIGSDWIETTDRSMGGASVVSIDVVEGGAHGTGRSLRISGEVADAGPVRWSGTVFFPGGESMAAADLSGTTGLRFLVRGDEGTYAVMLFSPALGPRPILRSFEVTDEWSEVSFAWEDFGSDGTGITGLGIVAGTEPRPFIVFLDQVEVH